MRHKVRHMKNKPNAIPRGVSLPQDVDAKVQARIEALKPKVKGFSHYVQLLVDWDLKRQTGKAEAPFNHPEHQLARAA